MIKKCLKVLCILGLTLLPISFSSAYTYKQDFDIPDTLGYYWYKVELMSNLFGILYVVLFVLGIGLFIYFISKS